MVIMTHIEINSTIKFKEYIYNFDDTKTYIHTLVSGLRVLRPQHFYKQKISDFLGKQKFIQYLLLTTENIGLSGILFLYISKQKHTCFNTRFDTKLSNHFTKYIGFSGVYKVIQDFSYKMPMNSPTLYMLTFSN